MVKVVDRGHAADAEVVVDDAPVAAEAPDEVVADDAEGADKLPRAAKRNADGTISLTLREPVALQVRREGKVAREEVYATLKFHRMTGADLQAIAATADETRLSTMVGRSLRISLAVAHVLFAKMDARDARDAARCAGFFTGSGD